MKALHPILICTIKKDDRELFIYFDISDILKFINKTILNSEKMVFFLKYLNYRLY